VPVKKNKTPKKDVKTPNKQEKVKTPGKDKAKTPGKDSPAKAKSQPNVSYSWE